MKEIDLSALTEKELIVLKEKIDDERKRRDDKDLYKYNYGFKSEEEVNKIQDCVFHEIERQQVPGVAKVRKEQYDWHRKTISKFSDHLLFICDTLSGNFRIKCSESGDVTSIHRETHMILPDRDKEERDRYRKLYDDMMRLIIEYADEKVKGDSK